MTSTVLLSRGEFTEVLVWQRPLGGDADGLLPRLRVLGRDGEVGDVLRLARLEVGIEDREVVVKVHDANLVVVVGKGGQKAGLACTRIPQQEEFHPALVGVLRETWHFIFLSGASACRDPRRL